MDPKELCPRTLAQRLALATGQHRLASLLRYQLPMHLLLKQRHPLPRHQLLRKKQQTVMTLCCLITTMSPTSHPRTNAMCAKIRSPMTSFLPLAITLMVAAGAYTMTHAPELVRTPLVPTFAISATLRTNHRRYPSHPSDLATG